MSSQRVKTSHETSSDIISGLPNDAIECILSKLSIKEAAKTSVLSWIWRYKWVSLPNLILDSGLYTLPYEERNRIKKQEKIETLIQNRLIDVIGKILMQHDGPIRVFTLSNRDLESCKEIDIWITCLSSKDVEYFTLEFWETGGNERYKVHSKLFLFPSLKSLKLRYCVIQLPSIFVGLKFLTTLNLTKVTIATDAFKNLTANCSVLSNLELSEVNGIDCVDVLAPKIQSFLYYGDFQKICFKSSTLVSLSVIFTGLPKSNVSDSYVCMIMDAYGSTKLESLVAGNIFLKGLGLCDLSLRSEKLFISLDHLSYIHLHKIGLKDLDVLSASFWLIKCSTRLQKLVITVSYCCYYTGDMGAAPGLIQKEGNALSPLKLTHIDIKGISGNKAEMELIKILLAKSPFLQTMTIQSPDRSHVNRILTELLSFCLASTKAQIIFTK